MDEDHLLWGFMSMNETMPNGKYAMLTDGLFAIARALERQAAAQERQAAVMEAQAAAMRALQAPRDWRNERERMEAQQRRGEHCVYGVQEETR